MALNELEETFEINLLVAVANKNIGHQKEINKTDSKIWVLLIFSYNEKQ